MKRKNKKFFLVLDLVLILVLAVGLLLAVRAARRKDLSLSTEEDRNRRYLPYLSYQGKNYPLKRNMSAVLLIGTDNYADDEKQIQDEEYYHNFNLADFLVILVFDHTAKTVTPFQIGRDTMCEVTRIDTDGSPLPSQYMQITLSHSYGTGKEDSCINTRNCVENLLFHVPIDNYLAFTMDTVPLINDLVGGVTVTLESDVPSLGKEFIKGATVTLRGKDALSFVRYRNTKYMNSNQGRMANHRLYMDAFTVSARAAAEKNPDLALDAFKLVERFLCTDLTVDHIQRMIDQLISYEYLPFVTPGGVYEFREGERFPGFYADEASLWSCVKSTFCV